MPVRGLCYALYGELESAAKTKECSVEELWRRGVKDTLLIQEESSGLDIRKKEVRERIVKAFEDLGITQDPRRLEAILCENPCEVFRHHDFLRLHVTFNCLKAFSIASGLAPFVALVCNKPLKVPTVP